LATCTTAKTQACWCSRRGTRRAEYLKFKGCIIEFSPIESNKSTQFEGDRAERGRTSEVLGKVENRKHNPVHQPLSVVVFPGRLDGFEGCIAGIRKANSESEQSHAVLVQENECDEADGSYAAQGRFP
jgi:hypothetical protein